MQQVVIGDEYWPGKEKDSDEEILAVVRDSLMTIWHASCTCKMGKKDDDMAVVDPEAKVYGVQGLRVVDASALPILPPGHPTSTICKFSMRNSGVVWTSANICVDALAEKIAAGIVEANRR